MPFSFTGRAWGAMGASTLLFILATAPPLEAQVGGTIRGTITEESTQRPLASVRVVLIGVGRETRTGEDGRFEVPGLPDGEYTVAVFGQAQVPFSKDAKAATKPPSLVTLPSRPLTLTLRK